MIFIGLESWRLSNFFFFKMPQIAIYVDNKTYVEFLQKKEEERDRIRKEAQLIIVEEVNKSKG